MQQKLDFSRLLKRPKLEPVTKDSPPLNYHDVKRCPVCSLNLSNFLIYEKEYHVSGCLGNDVEFFKGASSREAIIVDDLEEIAHEECVIIIDDEDDENDQKLEISEAINSRTEVQVSETITETSGEVPTTKTKSKAKTKTKTKKVTKGKPSSPKPKKVRTPRQKPLAPYFKTLTFPLETKDEDFLVAVDGFNYSYSKPIDFHFLSHFHSDHYIGMSKSWFTTNSNAKIYTSQISKELIIEKISGESLGEEAIVSIGSHEWETLASFNGVEHIQVIALDAHHCPGGVIFMFKHYVKEEEEGIERLKKVILHTGDFRVSKKMICEIKKFAFEKINEIYLDTTYLDPIYLFIEQSSLVKRAGVYLRKRFGNDEEGKGNSKKSGKSSILDYFGNTKGDDVKKSWVLLIGTYSIGKENLYLRLSEYLNTKILIPLEKFKMIRIFLTVDELLTKFVIFDTKPTKFKNGNNFYEIDEFKIYNLAYVNKSEDLNCLIHLLPIGKLSDSLFLNKFYNNKKIIKIRPTGWCFRQFTKTYSFKDDISNDGTKMSFLDKIWEDNEVNDEEFDKTLNEMLKFKNEIHLPYSEHSNFKELSLFCTYLKWDRIIPTVSNHYQKDIYKENCADDEFQKWFRVWKKAEIKWDIIEDYYKDEI